MNNGDSINTDSIIVYPNSFVKQQYRTKNKYFVFDLDETIGSFGDLYILWKGFFRFNEKKGLKFEESQEFFNSILELYPEFLRYGILTILEFLFYKKTTGKCQGVYIYTNNQCSPPWVNMIIKYLEVNRGLKGLFEPPICAFKINNCILEPRRTTGGKPYEDFIKCTLLPKTAEICYLDNAYFPRMNVGQEYYIQPKSYIHPLSSLEIVNRLERLGTVSLDKELISWILNNVSNVKKTKEMHEHDMEITRQLLCIITDFFTLSPRKRMTRRRRKTRANITQKKC